jgi:hypothetical protein
MEPPPTELSLAHAAERFASIPWASMTGWEATMADYRVHVWGLSTPRRFLCRFCLRIGYPILSPGKLEPHFPSEIVIDWGIPYDIPRLMII